MTRFLMIFAILFIFAGVCRAVPSNPPQRPFTLPSGQPAIPAEISNQMTRQEQRLDAIDTRLAVIEKSVSGMEGDVKALVKTDTILDFLIGMVKLFIPGIILTYFGVRLNRRIKDQKTNSPANPQ